MISENNEIIETCEQAEENAQQEPAVTVSDVEVCAPETETPQVEENTKKCGKFFMVGLIASAVGSVVFLLSVFASLLFNGEVGLFDGTEFFFVMAWISCSLIVIGFIIMAVFFIIHLIKKNNYYLKKTGIFIFTIVMFVVCVALGIWGAANYVESQSTSYYSVPEAPSVKLSRVYSSSSYSGVYFTRSSGGLKIDTNPYNFDSDESGSTKYASSAMAAIKDTNSKLNVPSYIYDDMLQTSALDGRQYYTAGNIEVSWVYHPDIGLEVTYRPAYGY